VQLALLNFLLLRKSFCGREIWSKFHSVI
jgi:hypothetical protein